MNDIVQSVVRLVCTQPRAAARDCINTVDCKSVYGFEEYWRVFNSRSMRASRVLSNVHGLIREQLAFYSLQLTDSLEVMSRAAMWRIETMMVRGLLSERNYFK